MSVYAEFGKDGPVLQVASIAGWGEFGDWVETLSGYSRINALWNDGKCSDIPGLRDELEHAIESDPPKDDDTLSVAHGVIEVIDSAPKQEFMFITSGIKLDPEKDEEKPADSPGTGKNVNGKHLGKRAKIRV